MYTGKKTAMPQAGKLDEGLTRTFTADSLMVASANRSLGSMSNEEAEGFFSNLIEAPAKQEATRKSSNKEPVPTELAGIVERVSRNINWNEGVERVIKQNLLIGNLTGAVDCCMKCGRTVSLPKPTRW